MHLGASPAATLPRPRPAAVRHLVQYNDGGGLYTRDTNTTVFLSTFTGNSAIGSGGALALRNNLDVTIDGNAFNSNSASSFGGAVVVSSAPFVLVRESNFSRNVAGVTAGALSIQACDCVMVGRVAMDNNTAHLRGGALHLQPPGKDRIGLQVRARAVGVSACSAVGRRTLDPLWVQLPLEWGVGGLAGRPALLLLGWQMMQRKRQELPSDGACVPV